MTLSLSEQLWIVQKGSNRFRVSQTAGDFSIPITINAPRHLDYQIIKISQIVIFSDERLSDRRHQHGTLKTMNKFCGEPFVITQPSNRISRKSDFFE